MAGTELGGAKASVTNKAKYDEKHKEHGGFYAYIGSLGGKKGTTGGFYATKNYPLDHPAHPSNAGRKGGINSWNKRKELHGAK